MKTPIRFLWVVSLALIATLSTPSLCLANEPFDVRDLLAIERLSSFTVSPDGSTVAFVLRTTDLEADRGRTDLWAVGVDGQDLRRLTTHEASDFEPSWSPDGRSLFFLSTRSGSSQVWRLPVAGGEAQQVTDLALDVSNLLVSPKGTHLAFTLEVFPDCQDLACTTNRLDEREKAKTTGVVYDQVFIRHWDTWKDGRRSHLFTQPLGESGRTEGEPKDLTAGLEADVPSKPFGGSEEIAWTPDGRALVFSARLAEDPETGNLEPWSTNFDLWTAPADGSEPPRNLTAENLAWDTHPVFAPTGDTLAYLAMERPGYESDRFRLMMRSWPNGEPREIAGEWDRSIGDFLFSADGKTIFATANSVGARPLFAIDVATGQASELVGAGSVSSPDLAGDRVIFGWNDLKNPVELYSVRRDGGRRTKLTTINDTRMAGLQLGDYEQFSFAGWNGETVYGYVVTPADFDPQKKYPIAFLIHGGPQGSFGNNFHYRWNPQTYAGAGFAAVMIDFHGSVGYGQDFTDAIHDDWGGKPLEDLQKGLAAAVAKYPYLDGEKACALGASYGGYMINWIAGTWPERFRCLVNHDGLFDNRSMYYTTEELWFPEWDHAGPYWKNPEAHERHNPVNHVDQWRTPMLVIHGGKDFRVPETQGFATFTALQRKEIPSKLLYFPDENHWVLKPNNSIQWHDEVNAWLKRWLD